MRDPPGTIPAGVAAGLIAGIVIGIMKQAQSMMLLIGEALGTANLTVGWLGHLLYVAVLGAIFGAIFGALLGRHALSVRAGKPPKGAAGGSPGHWPGLQRGLLVACSLILRCGT